LTKIKNISFLFIFVSIFSLFLGVSSSANNPNNRFLDNGDGTITDLKTNLMWLNQKEYIALAPFDEAKEYCKSFNYNNHSDWRLPTKNEFNSIIDKKNYPAIISVFQLGKADIYLYWTQVKHKKLSDRIWVLELAGGKFRHVDKDGTLKVWPVRDIK